MALREIVGLWHLIKHGCFLRRFMPKLSSMVLVGLGRSWTFKEGEFGRFGEGCRKWANEGLSCSRVVVKIVKIGF